MWQKYKKYATLVIGVILIVVALKVITYPIDSHTSYLSNSGAEATATVSSKFDTKIRTKGRYGTKSEWTHYKLFVDFYDSNFLLTQMEGVFEGMDVDMGDLAGSPRMEKIDMYVTADEYNAVKEGDKVEVVFIEGFNAGYEGPIILLKSTVESSFFKRFGISITGHFESGWLFGFGIILMLAAVLTTLIGLLLAFRAKTE